MARPYFKLPILAIRRMIPAMKWMVAMCALVVTGGLVQAQVASGDSPPGGITSSEQQPPSDLLPKVDELPPQPAVARGRTGMASIARAGRVSRHRRSRGYYYSAGSRRSGHHHYRYVRHARFERGHFAHYRYHPHPARYRHSLAHRHRHRRHFVLSPYGPYMVPAAFYGPPGPYYGPPYDPF